MSVISILGIVIVAAGVFLWVGNVSRLFPTFPLAGYVTIVVGGIVFRAGKKQ